MNEKKEWRPLPDSITNRESKIEGLGVFATKAVSYTHLRAHETDY